MAQLEYGGTLSFKAGGVPYTLAATFKIDPGGYTRTARSNIDGTTGFTGKYRVSMWEVELSDSSALSVFTVQGLQGVVFTAQLANGKSYMLQGWQEGDLQMDVVEGKVPLKLAGPPSAEVL